MGVSADTPQANRTFIQRFELPFLILSDPEARLAGPLNIPTSTKHPMALFGGYPNGFLQPAVFFFDARGNKRFAWIHKPKARNFYGASQRMSPGEILEMVTQIVSGDG